MILYPCAPQGAGLSGHLLVDAKSHLRVAFVLLFDAPIGCILR